MRIADMEINKSQNLLRHSDEIKARPGNLPRTLMLGCCCGFKSRCPSELSMLLLGSWFSGYSTKFAPKSPTHPTVLGFLAFPLLRLRSANLVPDRGREESVEIAEPAHLWRRRSSRGRRRWQSRC